MTTSTDDAGRDRAKLLPAVHHGDHQFLDGMRGLSALYVAAYHTYLFTGRTGDAAKHLPVVGWFMLYGYLGVPIFIVLSGFVLMLPPAGNGLVLKGGTRRFIGRRARRILPPYYAALFASLALIAAAPLLRSAHDTQWDSKIPVTPAGIGSHLLLVHDISGAWIEKINGPLWSVAVEWQIYFFLPLALLPLWRRINPVLVVAGCLLAAVPSAITGRFAGVHPWFLGLFALGMLAAYATVNRLITVRAAGVAASVASCGAIALLAGERQFMLAHTYAAETIVGIAVALLITWAALGKPPAFLESTTLTKLGVVSYSVYLLHSPLLGFANLELLRFQMTVGQRYLLMTFVVLPAALAVCVGFYWLVERRFKNSHQHQVTQAARPSVLSQ